jgi:hypothetical protein
VLEHARDLVAPARELRDDRVGLARVLLARDRGDGAAERGVEVLEDVRELERVADVGDGLRGAARAGDGAGGRGCGFLLDEEGCAGETGVRFGSEAGKTCVRSSVVSPDEIHREHTPPGFSAVGSGPCPASRAWPGSLASAAAHIGQPSIIIEDVRSTHKFQ